MKILLFKTGAIGDTILSTPLIRQIKKQLPKSQIDYYIAGYCKEVLIGNKNLHEIITFDQNIFFKKKLFSFIKLVSDIKKRKYDVIFVLDKHRIFNITAKILGIPTRVGFDRNGEGVFLTHKAKYDGRQHEICSYLDLMKSYGLPTNYKDTRPEISLSKNDIEYANKIWKENNLIGKKVVCIAPGGANNPGQTGFQKIWPKEKYKELIKRLIEKKYYVVLVGDKHDVKTTSYITNGMNSKKIIDLASHTTIKQTASVMKKTNYVICNDTGPLHLSSCVNDKVISLFGPSRHYRFEPLNKNSKSIQSKTSCFDCVDIYGVFEKCGHKNVMNAITVNEVFKCIK